MAEKTTITIEDKEVRKLIDGLIKNVGVISNRGKAYVGLLSSIVLGDVVDHFSKEEGPNGKWQPWSNQYKKYMISIGKGGNLILSDTGKLRQGWQPARYRLVKDGILWFNPVEYAAKHDQGIFPYPKRKFTWISTKAKNEIERQTTLFIEDVK